MRTPHDTTNFISWLFGSTSKREAENDVPKDEEPPAKKRKTTRSHSLSVNPPDVLVHVVDGQHVTLYSDLIKQRQPTVAAKFITEVYAEGGTFIKIEGDSLSIMTDRAEITKLVVQARRNKHAAYDSPRSNKDISKAGKRELQNLCITPTANDDDDDDHPAVLLTKEAIAATAPDFTMMHIPDLGGTAFKPDLTPARLEQYITKANDRLTQKSETDLHKLIPELDDGEDAVHLYRNFNDEPVIGGRKAGESSQKHHIVYFSRREIDIIAYTVLHEIDYDYCWQLMPYRSRQSMMGRFARQGGARFFLDRVEQMVENEAYIHHLNKNIAILFTDEGDEE